MDAEQLHAEVPEDVDAIVDVLLNAKLMTRALPKTRVTAIAITKIEEAALWLMGYAAIEMSDKEEPNAKS